jgi:hypothetical protein
LDASPPGIDELLLVQRGEEYVEGLAEISGGARPAIE